jgi:hypothetical protein
MYINGDNKYVPCGDTKDMYFWGIPAASIPVLE